MVFDVTKPIARTRLKSQEIRDNFDAVGRASDLKCFAQSPPDITIYISPGRYSPQTTGSLYFAGGDSPDIDTMSDGSFGVPTGLPGQQRIVVAELTPTGLINLNYGVWASAGNATAPLYTSSNIALCEVLVTFGDQEITNDKIIDTRPIINRGDSSASLIAPDLISFTASDVLGPGLGQRSFDTSSSFSFFANSNEILVWSGGVYQVSGIDYEELNNTTIRFFTARPVGERVTIWKVGISAAPGTLGLADLSDVNADEAAAFNAADAPSLINPFLTGTGHDTRDHSTIIPIPVLLDHISTDSSKHDADQIDIDTSGIAFSSASDLQTFAEDVGTEVFDKFAVEHVESTGEHGPKVTITQTGADNALVVNHGSNTGPAIRLNKTAGTADCISVFNTGSGRSVVIEQIGVAEGIYVGQESNAVGVHIKSTSTTHQAEWVETDGQGLKVDVLASTAATSGWGTQINQNSPNAINGLQVVQQGSTSAVVITQSGNPGTGAALRINQNNTGVSTRAVRIDQAGNGTCLYINNSSTASAGHAIEINNAGVGTDILGNQSKWGVGKNGNASFANVFVGGGSGVSSGFLVTTQGSTLTIASGAITPTSSFHAIETEGGAALDDLDTITATGVTIGTILILKSVNGARDVVVKDRTGNIDLAGGDFTLDYPSDTLMLIRISTPPGDPDGIEWAELSRSNNHA